MATGDVIIRLAGAIGGSVADAFPWKDYRAALLEQLQVIEPDTASLLGRMEKIAAWSGEQTFERWSEALATPSGRFEFYSQAIASRLAASFPTTESLEQHLAGLGVRTRGVDLCLPHWEPALTAGDPRQYPFLLMPYRAIDYAEGGVRHLPWLRELPAAGLLAWKELIDVNPDDARRLDVRQGDPVLIESPVGRRRYHVRVHSGVRAGTIGLPLGHGPWPPTAEDAGTAGGHGLLVALSDPLAGTLAHQGTRVRVSKEGT